MMRILLVRPSANKNIATISNLFFGEPLGIECVSTIFKEQGHEVKVLDFMAESQRNYKKYVLEFSPDIIGFTSQCSDVVNILATAKETKKINKKIVVIAGGVQATLTPQAYFSPDIDYVIKTTARENMAQLTDQVQTGSNEEIKGIFSKKLDYRVTLPAGQNERVKADRACTSKYRKKYNYLGFKPCAVLQTSFGCQSHCSFCVRWRIEGAKFIELPVKDVVNEIESIKEPNIMICDNDFLTNEKRLTEIMDLLEERNIKKNYACYGGVRRILEKPHIMKRLAKNGLRGVIIGYETFSDNQLEKWNKGVTVDENFQAAKILKESGIAAYASFILHPDFSKEDFKKLKEYHKKLKPELTSFSPLVPHPSTPLYNQYKDRLIHKKEDYEKWNFGDVMIKPSKMSLRQYYFEVLKFGLFIDSNWHSTKYGLKTFPLKNSLGMMWGFRQIFKVYFKNILFGSN